VSIGYECVPSPSLCLCVAYEPSKEPQHRGRKWRALVVALAQIRHQTLLLGLVGVGQDGNNAGEKIAVVAAPQYLVVMARPEGLGEGVKKGIHAHTFSLADNLELMSRARLCHPPKRESNDEDEAERRCLSRQRGKQRRRPIGLPPRGDDRRQKT
jgi:hypothetical protein